ncbi:MAG TPA: hypothetical protein VGM86_25325 [Thermoanaerobaculia bacterium]|jgi:hypothetical protein
MRKNAPPKLALHRETLRNLSYDSLFEVRGGGPTAATTCCTMGDCTTACSADCPPQSDDCTPDTETC